VSRTAIGKAPARRFGEAGAPPAFAASWVRAEWPLRGELRETGALDLPSDDRQRPEGGLSVLQGLPREIIPIMGMATGIIAVLSR
jgi:hypothetical protein